MSSGPAQQQAGRVLTMCSERGIRIDRTVTEIGSWLNGRRTRLRKLLGDPKVSTIVVEHRDRLARFGVEHLEAALAAHGRTVGEPGAARSGADLRPDRRPAHAVDQHLGLQPSQGVERREGHRGAVVGGVAPA